VGGRGQVGDGFRAIVSTDNELEVRSRRGWNMTMSLPELRGLPTGLVVDGEVLRSTRRAIRTSRRSRGRYRERRSILEALDLNGPHWTTPARSPTGRRWSQPSASAASKASSAKKVDERYWPGARRWVKWKNPAYWRRENEVEGVRRSIERAQQRVAR
jgi:hypothetical protein